MKHPLKDALLIFTDGSSNGRAAYIIDGKGYGVWTDGIGVFFVCVLLLLDNE